MQFPTEKRCKDEKPHKFVRLIGGKGGYKCQVCGLIIGAMADKEYEEKIFKKEP